MTEPERSYQRRDRRKTRPDGHYMKARDVRILVAVHRYRVLTVDQIYRIAFFDPMRGTYPNKSVVYARLRRLFDHEYLDRDFLDGMGSIQNRKVLYFLAERGAFFLTHHAGYEHVNWHEYDNQIGVEHIHHLLLTNEFMSRFEQGCWLDPDLELVSFTDERQLKAEDYIRVRIIVGHNRSGQPIYREKAILFDGHIVYRQGQALRHLFLESDHGTHTVGLWRKSRKPTSSFRDKILAVIRARELIQARYGIRGFRMVTISPSARRTQNLYEVARKAEGRNLFWFGTLASDDPDSMTPHALFYEPIWLVCGEAQQGILTGDPRQG